MNIADGVTLAALVGIFYLGVYYPMGRRGLLLWLSWLVGLFVIGILSFSDDIAVLFYLSLLIFLLYGGLTLFQKWKKRHAMRDQ